MTRFRVALVSTLFAVAVSGLLVAAIADSPPYASPLDIVWATSLLAFPIVGALLALKVPRNAVGWLFLVSPSGVLWEVAFDEMGRSQSGSLLALGMMGLAAALILFPNGRYPNRWFRYAHFVVLGGLLVEPIYSPQTDGGVSFLANLLLAVAALVYRAVTGGPTLRRQVAIPIGVALTGAAGLALTPPDAEAIIVIVIVYLMIGVPTGIAVAIFRYRLYDFDRVVSRTVTYTLVVGLLIGVYALASVLLTRVIPVDSNLAVALSTLAAVALFAPVRKRLQGRVDRRFNRVRYEAGGELAAFSDRLQQIDRDEPMETDLISLLGRILQPRTIGVWIRQGPAGGS